MKLHVPKLSAPLKKFVGLSSMAFVAVTSLTGIYNYASAKMDEHKEAVTMKAAANCEFKLTNDKGPCTLDEQKALLKRAEIDTRIEQLRLAMETDRLWARLTYLIPASHTAVARP